MQLALEDLPVKLLNIAQQGTLWCESAPLSLPCVWDSVALLAWNSWSGGSLAIAYELVRHG